MNQGLLLPFSLIRHCFFTVEVYEAGFCVSRGVFRVPIQVIVIDIYLKGCMSFKIIGINKEDAGPLRSRKSAVLRLSFSSRKLRPRSKTPPFDWLSIGPILVKCH